MLIFHAGSIFDEVTGFLSIYLILTAALGQTEPLTEMSTRNLPSKADNLTAICEPIG
jgi:hypothetical protein